MHFRMKIEATHLDLYADKMGVYVTDVAKRALNLTADQIKAALVTEMKAVFDRPTPYTLNAPYVWHATRQSLIAKVQMREYGGKSRSDNYLSPQVYGGERKTKSFEEALRYANVLFPGYWAVPGAKAPLNAYGNVNPGFIVQLLSYFRAFGEQGYRANITAKRKERMSRGTKQKLGVSYFAIRQAGLTPSFKQPGIYRRTAYDLGTRSNRLGGRVEPMFIFVKKPHYQPLLKWSELAVSVAKRNWNVNVAAAQAIQFARKGE